MGLSPCEMRQVTCADSPANIGSSNENGMILGGTRMRNMGNIQVDEMFGVVCMTEEDLM